MKLDSKILYRICEPAHFRDSMANLKLAQGLIQLMLKEKGIGLAANQAGINVRLFVMYVENEIFHCFNPEIISLDQQTIKMVEGCLSFPGDRCTIERPDKITVKFYNARGIEQQRELNGIASRCFQHELDHLNGITMHHHNLVLP